jgi:hypothetical protein
MANAAAAWTTSPRVKVPARYFGVQRSNGRGQRVAVDEAANFGNEAIKIGSRNGNDALERIATQAKRRPMVTRAVAIGVGILIGVAVRRS